MQSCLFTAQCLKLRYQNECIKLLLMSLSQFHLEPGCYFTDGTPTVTTFLVIPKVCFSSLNHCGAASIPLAIGLARSPVGVTHEKVAINKLPGWRATGSVIVVAKPGFRLALVESGSDKKDQKIIFLLAHNGCQMRWSAMAWQTLTVLFSFIKGLLIRHDKVAMIPKTCPWTDAGHAGRYDQEMRLKESYKNTESDDTERTRHTQEPNAVHFQRLEELIT